MKKQLVRRSREEWEKLHRLQEESGQTIESFCKDHGVTLATFYYWRGKLKKKPATVNGFVPVVHRPGRTSGIVLRGRGGVEIEVSADVSMEKIQYLIAALSC